MVKSLPDVKYLNECFDYDRNSGMLTWKFRPREHFPNNTTYLSFKQFAGRKVEYAGNKGYYVVTIARKSYLVHRIVWKLLHGSDPSREIDHKDGNTLNNRPDNLRLATHAQNMGNTTAKITNESGFKNICLDKDRGTYRVRVYDRGNKRMIYRRCLTLAAAIEIAKQLNHRVHGEFSGYKRGE